MDKPLRVRGHAMTVELINPSVSVAKCRCGWRGYPTRHNAVRFQYRAHLGCVISKAAKEAA